MTETPDLDAYFRRIGYQGPHAATLEMLQALHRLHPAAIPFENLDPFLGRPVLLDMSSVERKLLHSGRGGYCFEQNGLFLRALLALGFRATGLSARVLRGRPESESPRSHMLLKIDLPEGVYIADIGFGSQTLTAPLRLEENTVQETPHGPFRLVREGSDYDEQALVDGEWQTQYRFSLQEYYPQDYEALNWYRATHPQSPFVTSLMAARPLPGKRLGLRDNHFATRHLDGRTEKKVLATPGEIIGVLEKDFGLTLPGPRDALEAGLARIIPRE